MRRALIILSALLVSDLAFAETIVYLHGRIIEVEGVQPIHQRFGLYDYLGIVKALEANGATVVSDVRGSETNVPEYARYVVNQIQDLIESGQPADKITVVGFSKGDALAASCEKLVGRNEEISSFHEIKLSTGKEHGAFYLPRSVWIDPLLAWVNGDHR